MANYITDTYSLMNAIKHNLRKYTAFDPKNNFKFIKSWNLGFVLPETILPAVTVFPLSKTFLPKRAGGKQPVDYKFLIDVYSKKYRYQTDAKKYSLEMSEGIQDVIKGSLKMVDADGQPTCYNTFLDLINTSEDKDDSNRMFVSKTSLEITCRAFHQMYEGRNHVDGDYKYVNFDEFLEKVLDTTQKGFEKPQKIDTWIHKTMKTIFKFPSIAILPGNEIQDDNIYSNHRNYLVRPVAFYIFYKGYPKKELLKDNIDVADELVKAIEKNYRVDGHAISSDIKSIDYNFGEIDNEFRFNSVVNVEYYIKRPYQRVVTT